MQNARATTRKDAATLAIVLVTALLALLFLAGTASAQVKLGGKLKSVATKALPAAVSPASSGGVKTGAVTFDERVLEITAERIDQFMAGLDAEVEMAAVVNGQDLEAIDRANAAADAAHEKEMAVYEAKVNAARQVHRRHHQGPGKADRARACRPSRTRRRWKRSPRASRPRRKPAT